MSTSTPGGPEHISEADLRAKLQAFQNGIQGKVDDKKQSILTVAGGAVLVLLILFFLLGKRSGKKQTTLVEIRRL